MTRRRLPLRAAIIAAAVALAGCSSDSAREPVPASDPTVIAVESTAGEPIVTSPGSDPTHPPDAPDQSAPSTAPPSTDDGDPTAPTSTLATTPSSAPTSPPPTDPPDAEPAPEGDELVLSDAFDEERETWADDEGTWEVDLPGESSATAIDGIGVMETDLRGTHEWVRALAGPSVHQDATLFARIRPIESEEGTVFIGLRGDGEWRDNVQYLPQTGVAFEYGYAPMFEGEIRLIVLAGPDLVRIGPVPGPVLARGESADIRFEVVGDVARAKVWRTGEDEPNGWMIETTVRPEEGLVHLSYRDGVGQSVAWEMLRLVVLPPASQ